MLEIWTSLQLFSHGVKDLQPRAGAQPGHGAGSWLHHPCQHPVCCVLEGTRLGWKSPQANSKCSRALSEGTLLFFPFSLVFIYLLVVVFFVFCFFFHGWN